MRPRRRRTPSRPILLGRRLDYRPHRVDATTARLDGLDEPGVVRRAVLDRRGRRRRSGPTAPGTRAAPRYGCQAPPSSRYSVLATPDPPTSLAVREMLRRPAQPAAGALAERRRRRRVAGRVDGRDDARSRRRRPTRASRRRRRRRPSLAEACRPRASTSRRRPPSTRRPRRRPSRGPRRRSRRPESVSSVKTLRARRGPRLPAVRACEARSDDSRPGDGRADDPAVLRVDEVHRAGGAARRRHPGSADARPRRAAVRCVHAPPDPGLPQPADPALLVR